MKPERKLDADARRRSVRGRETGANLYREAGRELRVKADCAGRANVGVAPILRADDLADAKVISRAVYPERTPTPSRTFGAWAGKPIQSGSVDEGKRAVLRAVDDSRQASVRKWQGASFEKEDLRQVTPGFGQTAKLMSENPKKRRYDDVNE
jgi:hypothetical protein